MQPAPGRLRARTCVGCSGYAGGTFFDSEREGRAPSPSQENAASATEPGPSYSYVSTGHSTREIDLTLPQNKEMQISSCKRGFANSQTIAN
jgi:hypothetical protein